MREPKRAKKREFNLKKRKNSAPLTFLDVLKATIDDVENSFSMAVYEHPTNLSPEQVIFSLEFMKNGYKAVPAIRETYGQIVHDWSGSRCIELAKKLLGLSKVKRFINQEIELRAQKLQITADWIAKKYKQWATINVTDYITIKHHEKSKRPYIVLKTELEKMPDEIKSAIKSISVTTSGDLKVEFVDQRAALDSLTKLLGFANDKINIETKTPIFLNFDSQDKEA